MIDCIDVICLYLKNYLTDAEFQDYFCRHEERFKAETNEEIYLETVFTDFRIKERCVSLSNQLREYVAACCPGRYEAVHDAYVQKLIEAGTDHEIIDILKRPYEKKERVEIDCGAIESVSRLHRILKSELRLGEAYGNHWDAFNDWKYDIIFPKQLVFMNWNVFKKRFPRDAAILREILDTIDSNDCKVQYNP